MDRVKFLIIVLVRPAKQSISQSIKSNLYSAIIASDSKVSVTGG